MFFSTKQILSILLLSIITLLMLYCSDNNPSVFNAPEQDDPNSTPSQLDPDWEYIPSEVAVVFQDTTQIRFAKSFAQALGLEILRIDFDSAFAIWTEVRNGEPDILIEQMEANEHIHWADARGYSGEQSNPSKPHILNRFFGTTDTTSAKLYLNGYSRLKIMEILFAPRIAVLWVPEGEEFSWSDSLETYPVVRWAEPIFVHKFILP